MEPSGPSNSMRSNLEGQSGQMPPSDEAFSFPLPPPTQYTNNNNNVNLLGDGHGEMDVDMQQLLTHHSDNHNQMAADQQNPLHLQQMQRFSDALINQPQQQQQIHPEDSMLSHQQQQQQRYLQWKQYFSVDAATAQHNQMQQQRLLDAQQYPNSQQHQLSRAFLQQRSQMQQQQLLQSRNLPMRSPIRPVSVEMCRRRIAQFITCQKHRQDNSIDFWRKFVKEFFTPNGKKVWCVSMYGKLPLTTGVFPQNIWHCEICKRKPGRGFEASFDYLPRLFKIKYESGIIEEHLHIDVAHGSYNPSGHIILTYPRAVQQTVYEQLRVVRYGQLRIMFSPDLKIRSWEFCAVKHEEVISRELLTSQVRHLANAAHKYQASTQNNAPSNLSDSDLRRSSCTKFVESARGVAQTLQGQLNQVGYSKRYVQCLQIAEVVDRMKDVIDFSLIAGTSPIESLDILWGRASNTSSGQNQDSDKGQRRQQHAQMGIGVANVNNTDQNQDPGNQNWPEYSIQNVWKPAS